MFAKPDNWNELSPVERRALRLDHWQNQPVEFSSPEAEANYRERIERLRKTYDMEHPDRIIADFSLGGSEYALRRKGLTGKDMVYNHDKLREPLLEFHNEFQPDLAVGVLPYPGRIMDMLDYRSYVWSGQKLPDNLVIQAVEGEYMMGDEFGDFIADPTDFWLKKYLPRALGELGPMAMLPDFPRVSEIVDLIDLVLPFGMPPFQAMLRKLITAGNELMEMLAVVGQTSAMIAAAGFPGMGLNIVKTPFDYLGDTLRGTKGILTDMFRRPNELLAACEAYVPVLSRSIIRACDRTGSPTALYVLHKGADGFMSQAQFEKFYWPSFRKLLLGLISEGLIPAMVVDGTYNRRLEHIRDLPRASVIWTFEKTDMALAKRVLGGHACIAGNVTGALLYTGTPEDVRKYCRWLIDTCGPGGGYILSLGISVNTVDPANLQAIIETAKQYGVYHRSGGR